MKRVVITGLGVVSPNGIGVSNFLSAIKAGESGIGFNEDMQRLGLVCNVAGVPNFTDDLIAPFVSEATMKTLKNTGIKYAIAAAMEAWLDAGLEIEKEKTDYDTGCVIGTGTSDLTLLNWSFELANVKETKKVGSTFVEQVMFSGPAAYVSGLLGLGNHVISNSSACSTGTESIIMAYQKIKNGDAKRMVAGSADPSSAYIWAGFDAMRMVLTRKGNENPTTASRPMSQTANGFVPSGGGAVIILEDLATAQNRGAKIYGEIIGGAINSGGQRNGGTMTLPNTEGVLRCFKTAMTEAAITGNNVDLVCGHLTSTMADKMEVRNWSNALQRTGKNFPYINSLKSMIGHTLAGSGSIECVAAILQLYHNFIHPSINCEDLHEEIATVINHDCVPQKKVDKEINTVIKANFGFGDVNSCIVLRKFKN